MNSRDKVKAIFDLKSDGRTAFWTGNPLQETELIYLNKLGFSKREEIFQYLNDDCRWIMADRAYRHPEGRQAFDPFYAAERKSLGEGGYFANCESIIDVEKYPWPDPDYLDFSDIKNSISEHKNKAVFTGLWSPFFHIMCDFFGMENYFVKMYTDPDVVIAVTDHIIEFLCEANSRLFKEIGNEADIFFFGNDFGSQIDLLISPEAFRKFILPGFKRLIDVAKKYDKKVLLHSCGSIYRVIPMLIDAGIDALHPIQAKAANMDAVTLSKEFKNDIAFVGGVDTQELLVKATPSQIKDEVYRLRELLGPNFIISPSHEALLTNVPVENVIAMAEAAAE